MMTLTLVIFMIFTILFAILNIINSNKIFDLESLIDSYRTNYDKLLEKKEVLCRLVQEKETKICELEEKLKVATKPQLCACSNTYEEESVKPIEVVEEKPKKKTTKKTTTTKKAATTKKNYY